MNGKIKDRGTMKWNTAFFMPEHISMLRDLNKDYYRQPKPILDQYQLEEFNEKICFAMEYNMDVKVTIWLDGFEEEYKGKIRHLDEIYKKVRLREKNGDFKMIQFDEITNITVGDD